MSKYHDLFVLAILASACGSSSNRAGETNPSGGATAVITSTGGVLGTAGTSANCPQGWLGCPCTPDKTCSTDLVCLSSADGSNTMCVRAEVGGGSSVAGSAGTGGVAAAGGSESSLGGSNGSGNGSVGGFVATGGIQPAFGGTSSMSAGGSGSVGGTASGGAASTTTDCPVVYVPLQTSSEPPLSCTIALPTLPPGNWWYVIAATDTGGQPVVIPPSQTEGWTYSDQTRQSLTLVGSACDGFKNGTYSNLRFAYTCEGGEIVVQ